MISTDAERLDVLEKRLLQDTPIGGSAVVKDGRGRVLFVLVKLEPCTLREVADAQLAPRKVA